jgi:hypothetical protein
MNLKKEIKRFIFFEKSEWWARQNWQNGGQGIKSGRNGIPGMAEF